MTAPQALPPPPAVPGGDRGRRTALSRRRRPSGQACRTGDHALLLRQFVDALRACLDKAPLYGGGYVTEAERFYQPPSRPFSNGRTPARGSET